MVCFITWVAAVELNLTLAKNLTSSLKPHNSFIFRDYKNVSIFLETSNPSNLINFVKKYTGLCEKMQYCTK